MASEKTDLKAKETQEKTRMLLALWDLGGVEQEVTRGLFTKRVVSKGKKVADYESMLDELQTEGAIAISKKGYTLKSPKGLEVIGEGLKNPEFRFEGTIVGTWAANALLKWIAEMTNAVKSSPTPVNSPAPVSSPAPSDSPVPTKAKSKRGSKTIASYDEFMQATLKVYDQLNSEYNYNDLVPIYALRREIGDRVGRDFFNAWLLEMQENDILQLQGGSLADSDPSKIEDSITTAVSGLRCYAKRLES
jgi:hypothetical protein